MHGKLLWKFKLSLLWIIPRIYYGTVYPLPSQHKSATTMWKEDECQWFSSNDQEYVSPRFSPSYEATRYGERNREGLLSKLQINRPVLLKFKIKFVKRHNFFFYLNQFITISDLTRRNCSRSNFISIIIRFRDNKKLFIIIILFNLI